jgi:hypothetical protein
MVKIYIKNKFGKTVSLAGSMAARARERKKRLKLIQSGGNNDFIFEYYISGITSPSPLEQQASETSFFSSARLTPEAIDYGIAMENIATLPTDLLAKFIECKKNYIGSVLYRLVEERPKLYSGQVTPESRFMYINFISLYTVIILCELTVFNLFLDKIKTHPLFNPLYVFYTNAFNIVTRNSIFKYAMNDIDNIEYKYLVAAAPIFDRQLQKTVRHDYSISYMSSIMYNKMLLTCDLIPPHRMARIMEYRKVYYKKIGLLNHPLLSAVIKYQQIIIDKLGLCKNNSINANRYGQPLYDRILSQYKRSDSQQLVNRDIIAIKEDLKLITAAVPGLSNWF